MKGSAIIAVTAMGWTVTAMGWTEKNAHYAGNFGSPQVETCHIKLHFGLPVDVLTACSLPLLCLFVSEIFHTQSRCAS